MMSTNVYTMRLNDHHVYHDATMIAIPSGCLDNSLSASANQPAGPEGVRIHSVGPHST